MDCKDTTYGFFKTLAKSHPYSLTLDDFMFLSGHRNCCGRRLDNEKAIQKLIYLATPYNDPDPIIREERFLTACKIAAHFISQGVHLFCPIAHNHPINKAGNLPKGWSYWQVCDRAILKSCSEIWVAQIIGWDKSEGIKGELEIARELGLTIKYVISVNDPVPNLLVVSEEDFE